ncbi:MAG: YkgJ family cysteine cluster protein [Deltaproteobacteria bacterium]|nr:YkgJ family cysteine cluster protein [Deltaproteobacteria bacterium]MBW2072516.1 YkgJ family cysteine cluster protein [Deltaproteobacteria bacterium]
MELDDLYQLIPDFMCTPGCHECCRSFGVPSQTKAEAERIKQFLLERGRKPQPAQGTTCPYLTEEGCSIYPVRPLICRLYGTSVNYLCKEGVKPLRLLHEDEEAEIFHLYQRHFF